MEPPSPRNHTAKCPLPTFLVVGTTKAGTTSLHHYLTMHPDVFMPDHKEPYFFVAPICETICPEDRFFHRFIKRLVLPSLEEYRALFEGPQPRKARGEATPVYLYYHETAIPRIKHYLGNPKIVIILRNPIEKAFSQYKYLLRFGCEDSSFERALESESLRIERGYDATYALVGQSLYYDQVKAYLDAFSEVKILFYDDLVDDAPSLMRELFRFLEVDPTFRPDTGVVLNANPAPPRHFRLHRLLQTDTVRSVKQRLLSSPFVGVTSRLIATYKKANRRQPVLHEETRRKLVSLFRDDIEKLSKLVGRDLTVWLR